MLLGRSSASSAEQNWIRFFSMMVGMIRARFGVSILGFQMGSLLKDGRGQYGAAPGIWLSPWGGYDKAKEERMKYGGKQGFEMNEGGFALSGPKYFTRFREVTLDFIRKDGINQFKIDGTGNVNSGFPGSEFDSDFHAAISLIGEWRALKPDIFVNLTTGTYPSPFWLRYADSIWRGGEDHSFAGVGPWREKWITYRDAKTYAGIVRQGPLYPLNSLMLHGIIYARQAEHLGDDPEHVFVHEVHDYFGEGTQLQEMYITHSLLTENDWDVLAEAAKWSRQNAVTLADTHWIGRDPGSWKFTAGLRGPRKKAFSRCETQATGRRAFLWMLAGRLNCRTALRESFMAHSPWERDREKEPVALAAGELHTFRLKPFEVLNLEAAPVR